MKNRISEYGKELASRPSAERIRGPAARYFKTLEEAITEYPAASLAAAVLIGVVLAFWIKRR